ncbi:DUF4236 domain-containing protein [Clostridium pasteurianum]|uniref:DUF4236 domain-containing protein n=1 Tax=Clostridium pasteurianum BC1 TaxID=86416 RepID=R4KDE0_CLOPA|nr:DUF4236 domain-containing protein [Clostridium pasteurianum]AGK97640.1 hypothetical protein Clopa_2802 [Clostridium pasteurianum BC1]
MGLIFKRRIKICKGITLNLGKKGINSVSVGRRGAHVTIGKQGVRKTVGIPGSGLSYTDYKKYDNNKLSNSKTSKMISDTAYTKEQLKANDKLLQKHNNKIANKAVIKLIKKCLIWFFILAIADGTTIKSDILLWLIVIGVNIVCWSNMFYIVKKWSKANKENKLMDEG